MTFIIDQLAYRSARLYAMSGHEIIAALYLRKAYGR